MPAYYNENDAFVAQWLRNLIAAGHIAPGDVDERSIVDVRPDDLVGYAQCHFFAGIGGWSYALRLAGWPDERPVWTASVPCQPYSVASVSHGGAQGISDHRDLWPILWPLAQQHQPARLFGEQVASAIKWGWWDRAALDLETEGYAVAAAVLRADAAGGSHERKRLYWVGYSRRAGRARYQPNERAPSGTQQALTINGDPLAGARRALDGDYSDLLSCDGLSVVVERLATKGYGNAIVPQVAAQFIAASIEAING